MRLQSINLSGKVPGRVARVELTENGLSLTLSGPGGQSRVIGVDYRTSAPREHGARAIAAAKAAWTYLNEEPPAIDQLVPILGMLYGLMGVRTFPCQ